MILKVHIYQSFTNEVLTYNLSDDREIRINEYDFVYFELLSHNRLEDIKFVLGNTIINFSADINFIDSMYSYSLAEDEISEILPNDSYFSNIINLNNKGIRFSKLFINELGFCKPSVIINEEIHLFQKIEIQSPKINDENFKLIINYLSFNNYFDDKIIYKNTLPSENKNFSDSFFESLKKLVEFTNKLVEHLYLFKNDSITKLATQHSISKYNHSQEIDNSSIEWLFNNLEQVNRVDAISEYSIKINSQNYEVDNILEASPFYSNDTYENKIILGFLETILSFLQTKHNEFKKNSKLRTRIFSFNDYLNNNLNDIITIYILKIQSNLITITDFFKNTLKVGQCLYGFPTKIEGFLNKPHYKLFLDLIYYSKNIFSLEIEDNKKYDLEIESFDKLYEVYCFYFIKDSLINFLGNKINIEFKENSSSGLNKLEGCHIFNGDSQIELYYETLPEDFFQLASNNPKFYEKPDFIIKYHFSGKNYFLILDAKYKNYNKKKVEDYNREISRLSFKYLHKIGTLSPVNIVLALYVISIGKGNILKPFHLHNFSLSGPTPIVPQIGRLELNPSVLSSKSNPIIEVLNSIPKLHSFYNS